MPNSYSANYCHFVWATWNRAPTITREIANAVRACVASASQQLGCLVVEIGGRPDHVHALLRVPPTAALSDVAKQIKGSSSHFVNHTLALKERFRWQGSYGVTSVSPHDVEVIAGYVRNQARHHRSGSLRAELEACTDDEAPSDP